MRPVRLASDAEAPRISCLSPNEPIARRSRGCGSPGVQESAAFRAKQKRVAYSPQPGALRGTGPQAQARGLAVPRSGDAENDRECDRAEGHHAADGYAHHQIPLPAAVVYDGVVVLGIC
jgi:hypothetical protein